jgi:hypothetical protein
MSTSQSNNNQNVIKNYYFIDFDFEKGPENPADFYADFRIDVGEVDSDEITNYSVFVATTTGLQAAMRSEGWKYVFGVPLLIVDSYDLNLILKAVEEHIVELPRLATDVS